MVKMKRAIFRESSKSDYGKQLRLLAEPNLQALLVNNIFSRNQLLNESVEVFQNRSWESTNILHEYFIPQSHVPEFVEAMQNIIIEHNANLINVTVHTVKEDEDTYLRYDD